MALLFCGDKYVAVVIRRLDFSRPRNLLRTRELEARGLVFDDPSAIRSSRLDFTNGHEGFDMLSRLYGVNFKGNVQSTLEALLREHGPENVRFLFFVGMQRAPSKIYDIPSIIFDAWTRPHLVEDDEDEEHVPPAHAQAQAQMHNAIEIIEISDDDDDDDHQAQAQMHNAIEIIEISDDDDDDATDATDAHAADADAEDLRLLTMDLFDLI